MNTVREHTVAVVDDDNRVLESLKDLLESGGYIVRTFPSARTFLESGTLPSIGCLISDIAMPEMNGFELTTLASRERPALPVILITAHDSAERQQGTLRCGRPRFLFRKPFNGLELLDAVRALLNEAPDGNI
jgi:FixJ family two-component response regulator